jgi:hypothetical protein
VIKVMGVKRRTSAVGLSSAKKPAMFVMVSRWREESQRRSSANFSIPGHRRVDWVVGAMPAQVTNLSRSGQPDREKSRPTKG